jgi:hypothetical protein
MPAATAAGAGAELCSSGLLVQAACVPIAGSGNGIIADRPDVFPAQDAGDMPPL